MSDKIIGMHNRSSSTKKARTMGIFQDTHNGKNQGNTTQQNAYVVRKHQQSELHQTECKRAIRQAGWNQINNKIITGLQSNNSKPFWNNMKSNRQDSISLSTLKDKYNLVSDNKGQAEILIKV